MSGLESFSDWVLALLPRLFIYPGGLGLLAALLVLRVTSGGPAVIRPRALARDFLSTNLPALAVAWVGVALIPFPGASPLPMPPDRLALLTLPLLALALSGWDGRGQRDNWAAAAVITPALLAPLAGKPALLVAPADFTFSTSSILSILAVGVGLLAIGHEVAGDLAGAAIWLGWLALGVAPLLGWAQEPLSGALWAGALYLLLVVTLAVPARYIGRMRAAGLLLPTAGLLAVAALLAALLKV
jgi:hypothetical protein